MVPRLWKSLRLIHTSVKLVTDFPLQPDAVSGILIHTSVKLVTLRFALLRVKSPILIHTSVKLVTAGVVDVY